MSAAHPFRVLIVEQEAIVAHDTQQIAAGLGYDVCATTGSAEQALVEGSKKRPDVMLIDIGIKTDLDGTSATMRLRQRFNAPIIYLTAQADKPTVILVQLAEPYGYVMKPVKADELRIAIEIAVHRHRIDEALQESYKRLIAVLENIADGVVVTDSSGTFTHYNPAALRIFGRGPTETPTLAWAQEFNLFRSDGLTPLPEDELVITRALHGISSDQVEEVIRPTSRQQPRCLTVTGRPIRDAHGQTTGAVVIMHDTTEIRQARQQLAAANEALRISDHEFERMASVASHDLHESLSMVTSYVELLARRYADLLDADGRVYIARALDGTRQTERGIARLLALARVSGRSPPATSLGQPF